MAKVLQKTVLALPDCQQISVNTLLCDTFKGWLVCHHRGCAQQVPFVKSAFEPRNGASFRSFEKGLADRGGWRDEILHMPEIQASFMYPFSYAPKGGHTSGKRFWLFFGICLSPTPSRQPLFETSEFFGPKTALLADFQHLSCRTNLGSKCYKIQHLGVFWLVSLEDLIVRKKAKESEKDTVQNA